MSIKAKSSKSMGRASTGREDRAGCGTWWTSVSGPGYHGRRSVLMLIRSATVMCAPRRCLIGATVDMCPPCGCLVSTRGCLGLLSLLSCQHSMAIQRGKLVRKETKGARHLLRESALPFIARSGFNLTA